MLNVPSGPHLLLDGSSSTGAGTRVQFLRPVSKIGMQVANASTNGQVILYGAITSSGNSTGLTQLINWDASSNGSNGGTMWSTQDGPVSEVVAVLEAGASSGGASAWISVV